MILFIDLWNVSCDGTFREVADDPLVQGQEAVASGKAPKRFPSDLVRSAQRKLFMIETAGELLDLTTPPGNRLEALKGDRKGQHAIRANDQFRICFRWVGGHAEEVEITDYH